MNETEQNEFLLAPRYRLVADYPGNKHFELNKVINLEKNNLSKTGYAFHSTTYPLWLSEEFFNEFPHLFQKLRWYEERKASEMPKYLDFGNMVLKVGRWIKGHDGELLPKSADMKDEDISAHWHFRRKDSLPSTQEEYEKEENQNRIPWKISEITIK